MIQLTDAKIESGQNLNEIINNSTVEYHNQFCGVTKESDGWFEIDFRQIKINLTSYSLKSTCLSNYSFPKSWRIVGSNDRNKWTILSHRMNESSLKSRNMKHRFECDNNHQYYQYIRFIQEDSWNDKYKYNIILKQIELFGSINSST